MTKEKDDASFLWHVSRCDSIWYQNEWWPSSWWTFIKSVSHVIETWPKQLCMVIVERQKWIGGPCEWCMLHAMLSKYKYAQNQGGKSLDRSLTLTSHTYSFDQQTNKVCFIVRPCTSVCDVYKQEKGMWERKGMMWFTMCTSKWLLARVSWNRIWHDDAAGERNLLVDKILRVTCIKLWKQHGQDVGCTFIHKGFLRRWRRWWNKGYFN